MGNSTCPSPMKAVSNGAWQGDNPLDFALPLLMIQICLVLIVTRSLALLLRPLRQPRVIAEMIGGILLGPSALGRNKDYMHRIFPPRSMTVLDSLANMGLLLFLFLVGLELDVNSIRRTGRKALGIALSGITLPFLLGVGTSFVLKSTVAKGVDTAPFLVFMGVAFSITAFPVLARILAELKLLTTDIGRIAMSAAAVNDVAAWILLALAVALSGTGRSPLVSLWVLLSGVTFVIFAVLAVRPVLAWMARRSDDSEPVHEGYMCVVLAVVLAAGFATDAIGIHVLFGGFVMGLLMPKEGAFAVSLTEKIEDLVSGLFLPLYFVSSGLKTDVATIRGAQSWGMLGLVILTACVGKFLGTVGVSKAFKMPCREALALGFLMNTKGLVELIVLNIGKDRKVLNDQTFAIMVLMALFTTFITTPLVTAVYKPARKAPPYKHRTIQRKNPDSELRMLACLHNARSIPALIHLIEASRGTRRRLLCVYAMHLMELSERPSAILMANKVRHNGLPFWNKSHPNSDHIVVAFDAYHSLSSVSVRPMTAISSLTTMHEDICSSAEHKRAALIVLPFHKQARIDGNFELTRPGFRQVNLRVLENAPCSVAIFVDRGLGAPARIPTSDFASSIAMLFFGGQDDREALAYAARMAEHPGVSLIVHHFLPVPQTNQPDGVRINMDAGSREADKKFLVDFQAMETTNQSIRYEELEVRNREETVAAIRNVARCNLVLVGRRAEAPGFEMRSTDCTELGLVGSFLASQEFTGGASVLVVGQYNPGIANGSTLFSEDTLEMSKTPGDNF
ncbi:cation/H(+) antiporter 19 isoform X2 [Amborella trichopoda]|uniref:cation/H(+) antiporter 19 isoform X2 n=2 Tax=Amborella trichopoda TaxID=13333 RepID=UPI0009BF9BE1|nr:cation/H(+) antiporter 19 isoform X2 [Amborella trichopoda]|eukprot:XP_020524140.1 cation/H(+) antiporter 19 isoform X2 [Amborella trichopoda]